MGRRTLTDFKVSYQAAIPDNAAFVLAPAGLDTPHGTCMDVAVTGGSASALTEAHTGQTALCIVPEASELTVTWHFSSGSGAYPEAMFVHRKSRFTRFADALVHEANEAAGEREGLDRAIAIACATAERFTYGHPEAVFNEGLDEVPALGCGLVEGSCVDINTYFIAALRAAGIEAGYATGFFFPAEKRDHCEDGHCWVVTRIDGATQEWDIAHHLKLGTRTIAPGLNPKPGFRAACFHSMGIDFPSHGIMGLKALIEPIPLGETAPRNFAAPEIRLDHPAITAVAE